MGKRKRVVVGREAIKKRLQRMMTLREQYEADIDNVHIKLQKGNSKTGSNCYTISLIPIADCLNCSGCWIDCYDIQHDCIYPSVIDSRAKNSAVHRKDRKRFWQEVDAEIKEKCVTQLRLNVGGDLDFADFEFIRAVGEWNPQCDILFFTKNYDEHNAFIDMYIATYPNNFGYPDNVKPIYSAWIGMEMKNPYGVPVSHVLWEDGSTTAPEYGSYFCGGNCSRCHFNKEGCWTLKNGESVIFEAH